MGMYVQGGRLPRPCAKCGAEIPAKVPHWGDQSGRYHLECKPEVTEAPKRGRKPRTQTAQPEAIETQETPEKLRTIKVVRDPGTGRFVKVETTEVEAEVVAT